MKKDNKRSNFLINESKMHKDFACEDSKEATWTSVKTYKPDTNLNHESTNTFTSERIIKGFEGST